MIKRFTSLLFCLLVSAQVLLAQRTLSQKQSSPSGAAKSVQQAAPTGMSSSFQQLPAAVPLSLQSTPPEKNCFSEESEKILQQKNPRRLSNEQFEERLRGYVSSRRSLSSDETVYTIPVIVHVVHYGEPVGVGTNISKAQVMSQFDVLNEDFRRMGAGSNTHPDGADIFIQFVPALYDPQGRLLEEPGIDRVFGYSSTFDYAAVESELKPNTIWNPDQYLNIWTVNFGGGMSSIAGYAQFPSLSGLDGLPEDQPAETDGVVIGYKYFGRTANLQAPYDKGRTTTHEVGHWLGLRHIWGDGDCSVDDFCADTPNQNGPNRGCQFSDTCPEEGVDMIENYMNYTDDVCMNVFTVDQRTRMRTVLDVSPRRNTLVACQRATPALMGTNTASPRQWFEYTAGAAQVITISSVGQTTVNTRLTAYMACHEIPVNKNDDAFGTTQSMLNIQLQAGETVKLLWEGDESGENFDWVLSTNAVTTGSACQSAAIATEGTNHLPATTLDVFWYSFTPSTDNKKITIDGNGKPVAVYTGYCDRLTLRYYGADPYTIYNVTAEDALLVAIEAGGGDADWSLTTQDIRAGERCTDAVNAVTGSNIIPYNSPFEYWYSYKIGFNGRVTISAADRPQGNARLTIFKGCDKEPWKTISETEYPGVALDLKNGETIKIRWEGIDVTNYEWMLQATQFTNGEICSVALTAQQGLNTADFAPQWFRYTTTKKTNLRISSVGTTEVDTHLMIKRSCNGLVEYDNDNSNLPAGYSQSELILFGLNAGETVYILWAEKWSYEGFDWTIEEIDPLPGDNCSTAKPAVIGTNTVDYNNGHANFGNIFWSKFTVPSGGKKITAFASIPVDVAIYSTQNCQTYTWLAEDQGKAQVFNAPAGTELLIIWDGNDYQQDFTWTLSVESIAAGDQCSNPIHAVQGINTSLYTGVWYDYTMTQAGSLKVSAVGLTERYAALVMLDGCDGNFLYSNITEYTQLPSEGLIVGLEPGDRVLIYWTVGYPFSRVKWSLEEIPRKQGDVCSDPIPANYGINHADYATQWYSYTPAEDTPLKISSRAFTDHDTDLYVYDACGGNLLARSDDVIVVEDGVIYFQSEVSLDLVPAGQPVLIKWAGTKSIYPFSFEITNGGPRQGDTCADPITAVEGVNNAMKPNPSWFTFTMPETASLTLSSLGYTDNTTTIEIYDACEGTLLASDEMDGSSQSYVRIDELMAGQTIFIKCYNDPWRPSDIGTYDWRLIVGEPEPGLFCDKPAVAHEGLNATPAYVSEMYWFTFTMPASGKKLVIERNNPATDRLQVVGVVNDCDLSMFYAKGEDRVEVLDLAEGETVLIYWIDPMTGERPAAEWTLSVVEPEAGDQCEMALTVLPGINTCDGPTTWYQYTVPVNGDVRISSRGLTTFIDTYLEVYDACGGNLIASNDNPDDFSSFESEVLLEGVAAGETLFIRWSQGYGDQVPYQWRLTVENSGNHAPVLEDVSFQLVMAPVNGNLIGTVAATDADDDALHYAIIEGNEDGAFALHETTGALTLADASQVPVAGLARELTVRVTDLIESTEAIVSIDIITGNEPEVLAGIQVFPNPARERLTLQLPESVIVTHSAWLDAAGRVVLVNDASLRALELTSLPAGIYYLRLTTSAGTVTRKVAVVK